jgi:hypothetical protein
MHHTREVYGMPDRDRNSRDIAHHIFTGATAMIGVCLTIIALFRVMNFHYKTYADEMLGVNTFIFIVSAFISYLSLRRNSGYRLEWIADILFFIGMLIMVFAGMIIVFFAC